MRHILAHISPNSAYFTPKRPTYFKKNFRYKPVSLISLDPCSKGWSQWTLEHSVKHKHPSQQWLGLTFQNCPIALSTWSMRVSLLMRHHVHRHSAAENNQRKPQTEWTAQCHYLPLSRPTPQTLTDLIGCTFNTVRSWGSIRDRFSWSRSMYKYFP